MTDWDIDPESFSRIYFDELKDIDVSQIEMPDVERVLIIITTYKKMSKETKEFLSLLHDIPDELFDIINGKSVRRTRKTTEKEFGRLLRAFLGGGIRGRYKDSAVETMGIIKQELKMLVEVL